MKTLRSSKPYFSLPLGKAANYDDYQSYIEDHTQFNKEVNHNVVESSNSESFI